MASSSAETIESSYLKKFDSGLKPFSPSQTPPLPFFCFFFAFYPINHSSHLPLSISSKTLPCNYGLPLLMIRKNIL